ncbi:glycoside hydrolase family 2 TIM barrel-domain containing protein [Mucilaginibacter flavus]|uniref:glycoside hydrolase family 2 TIM barrel-domain containing protein n=1 Tax=Mucilaginibacter flavus TaxID=931504 RepID=UPI0025B4EB3E|nr:glycoside hydrolase family 2 TIM barrel-domain containing protein [Mucilaginibacter flavus]MDN3584254.1 glycoside hydrolase family 2 TIM barrel-domain containing protein [Mucilaginibacter flavus]
MKKIILISLIAFTAAVAKAQQDKAISTTLFNNNWEFVKNADTSINQQLFNPLKTAVAWQAVSLPHTANIEPVIKTVQQWQGICFYRKFFRLDKGDAGKHIAIRLDAAMNLADVYLNGKLLQTHIGGYLPVYIDITAKALFGKQNCLLIRLNNQDNPVIPPGKPIKDLDFNFYSGIYRNAWLIKKNKVYLTDAIETNHVNGGGVLIHYDNISSAKATLTVKAELKNDLTKAQRVQLKAVLYNASGKQVVTTTAALKVIDANGTTTIQQQLVVPKPALWSPAHPQLYKLVVSVLSDGRLVDSVSIQTGIREISFKTDGFYLNGSKYVLRGTNRHQEYPYIGYALSDNAQYRDVYKIKQAGFDFVRCSHYPPSPAFLAACDELGIFVMDSTPGWQFFGDATFQQNSLRNITDMIHRDRNHPSIILWEASLNETDMTRDYMEKAHAIVHTELPYTDTYTCGWMNAVYDVFIPARQHAKAPDYWKKFNSKPILIAEYGDWEYYAQNAGFNQTQYKDLTAEEKTSRQLRGDGEKRMLQQAVNFQEAHNDNLNGNITGDANWLMFDYKRGYAPDIESSGIMDIFRLPKFAYYFYQSQRDAAESKPMLFIANYWNDPATESVKIYSNCDQVELFLNGKLIGKQTPDTGKMSSNLRHAPFTFNIAYQAGSLVAKGYLDGSVVESAERRTPAIPYAVKLSVDYSGRKLIAGKNDVLFVYAAIVDQNGTIIPDAKQKVKLSLSGDGNIVGKKIVDAEAGIAAFVITTGIKAGALKLSAAADNLIPGVLEIK